MLEHLGVQSDYHHQSHSARINAARINTQEAPYELVRTMRASVLVLGPLLARFGRARVSLPGGCSIGARPVNLHLTALEQMGATIEIESGYINAQAPRLTGATIRFPIISVGATENTLMAASLAQGHTVIENAAREPEIVDLVRLLRSMGAKIKGEGTHTIHIEGVNSLGAAKHPIIADRIEAGTYVAAVSITGGRIRLPGVPASLMQSTLDLFESAGLGIKADEAGIEAWRDGDRPLRGVDVTTKEFPAFPTDMQAQFMAAMCFAEGSSTIVENIFENRFMHVPELCRLGADISIQGNTAIVRGKGLRSLSGATTMATDLRASASLVLAGLGARGETSVRRVYHLDRGYEKMERKLSEVGAHIRRQQE